MDSGSDILSEAISGDQFQGQLRNCRCPRVAKNIPIMSVLRPEFLQRPPSPLCHHPKGFFNNSLDHISAAVAEEEEKEEDDDDEEEKQIKIDPQS